jgi:dihydrofolate reductase
MIIRVILAIDPNGVIGVNGDLPWHYKADMQRFKALTMGATVIMGRKTFDSLPRPLVGRHLRVVSQTLQRWQSPPPVGCLFCPDFESALKGLPDDGEVYIAGGATIYEEAFRSQRVDFVDVTQVPEVQIAPGAAVTRFLLESWLREFRIISKRTNETEPRLTHLVYEAASHRVR